MIFFERNLIEKLKAAVKRSPVILINGARQVGKTTLIKHTFPEKKYTYVNLDDLTYLAAAKSDPSGFISNISKPVVIDEAQRAPELFLPIKKYVDENRKPGLFILTGSTNPLLISSLGEYLVGRMEILELFPLSQGEIINQKETFLDQLFSNDLSNLKKTNLKKEALCKKLINGGFPEIQKLNTDGKSAWFSSYIATILQREVKELAQIEGLTQLPNLLRLIATRAGALLNAAELSRSSGIAATTLHRYLAVLKALFLIILLPPWHANFGKRLVKSSKIYTMDPGILLHLIKADEHALMSEPQILGKTFENFIVTEFMKQSTWSKSRIELYHYRTQTGIEVDIVGENSSGKVIGIEIKSSGTVTSNDFKGLKHFQEQTDKNFSCGIVLYTGTKAVPFGKNLWAIPVSSMWSS